jgi:segregation and condensation protein B
VHQDLLVEPSPPRNGFAPHPGVVYPQHLDAFASDADLAGHLVALLFVATTPLSVSDLARLLEVVPERAERVCELLRDHPPLGLAVQRNADSVTLVSAPHSAGYVERYLGSPPPVRLSRAALESLAIIAYRQPVTRGEIDAVRGVNSDSAVSTLLGRGLVTEVGRRETAGRPALLATTPDFLQYLGITAVEALPTLPEKASRSDPAIT